MSGRIRTPKHGETIDLEYAIKVRRFRSGETPAPLASTPAPAAPNLPRKLRVLETFAGGFAGWSVGLHSTGCFETVAVCEIESQRREMLARILPGVPQYGDIRELTASRLRDDGVAAVDVLAGSPPCQDASLANRKGQGTRGARTGLFGDYVRLTRELRPRWAIFENVLGLSSRGLNGVLSDLGVAGYQARVFNIPASIAGAPIERERLWVLAWDAESLGRPLLDAGAAQEPPRTPRQSRQEIALEPRNARDLWGATWRAALAGAVSVSDGIPPGDARKLAEALGDSVVPQITQAIGFAIAEAELDAAKRLFGGANV